MSIKLKGHLAEKLSSRIETAYMTENDVIELKNVPCEIVFESTQTFIDHEGAEHNYLPFFHMMGRIKEITGDFPYHVSGLYFADEDKTNLERDILYYPSPKELAHLIEVGKFYSSKFRIPPVLDTNTYSFPALLDLTIIPPPDPTSYEVAAYDPIGAENADHDNVNLPIFYVGIVGSGINRRTDRLLDYYGIEFDGDFPCFAMTAESSGYTEPQLLEYMTEPEPDPVYEDEDDAERNGVFQHEDMSSHYITPEEEAELLEGLNVGQKEPQAEAEPNYQPSNPEDMLLAQADRNIIARVRERSEQTLQNSRDRQRSHSDDLVNERVAEMLDRGEQRSRSDLSRENSKVKGLEQSVEKVKSDERVSERQADNVVDFAKEKTDRVLDYVAKPSIDRVAARSVDSSRVSDVVAKPVSEVLKRNSPRNGDARREVTATVSRGDDALKRALAALESRRAERKAAQMASEQAVEPAGRAAEAIVEDVVAKPVAESKSSKVVSDLQKQVGARLNAMLGNGGSRVADDSRGVASEKSDSHSLKDMNGADVSDASEQAKIDDARSAALGQAAAESVQSSINSEIVKNQPDVLEEQAEVKMDLDPEKNSYVEASRDSDDIVDSKPNDVNNKDDVHSLRDQKGADVADTSEQTKVDDARSLALGQAAAEAVQSSIRRERGSSSSNRPMPGVEDSLSDVIEPQDSHDDDDASFI